MRFRSLSRRSQWPRRRPAAACTGHRRRTSQPQPQQQQQESDQEDQEWELEKHHRYQVLEQVLSHEESFTESLPSCPHRLDTIEQSTGGDTGGGGSGGGGGGDGRGAATAGSAVASGTDGAGVNAVPPTPLRAPVMVLRHARVAGDATEAAQQVESALLQAERAGTIVEGQLLGMAAAHANRLGLRNLAEVLCAYAWSRLPGYGGREVAELTAAAARLGCEDARFFRFAAAYCAERTAGFTCLRDVALAATSLLRKAQEPSVIPFDRVHAFAGLATAALRLLRDEVGCSDGAASTAPRDLADFLHALAQMLTARPLDSGMALHEVPVVVEAIAVATAQARRSMHRASAQDIAKLCGAFVASMLLVGVLCTDVLTPALSDVAQAVRFRYREFNGHDISRLTVAFAKVNVLDELVADVLAMEIAGHVTAFTNKDLNLVLWAASQPCWARSRCGALVADEVQRRDLRAFTVQDTCMAVQALAKLGTGAHQSLFLVLDEAFRRQLRQFSVRDQVSLFWAIAKVRAGGTPLCRLLVRCLAVESFALLPRDTVNAALWALAVLWSTISADARDESPLRLAHALLMEQPWHGAPAFEVANAVWALGHLPIANTLDAWVSVAKAAESLPVPEFSLHELCSAVDGLTSSCPLAPECRSMLLERFTQDLARRLAVQQALYPHDEESLNEALARACSNGYWSPALSTLAGLLGDKTSASAQIQPSSSRCSNWPAGASGTASLVPPERPPPNSHSQQHVSAALAGKDSLPRAASDGAEAEGGVTAWPHGQGGCESKCCPPVSTLPDVSGDSRLWLNSHCAYPGHCVRLKNTFIHMECAAHSSESETEDCVLCEFTRRRSRSTSDLPAPSAILGGLTV
eukprot:NODE_564_length_2928_cov_6.657265.p1 GENE.NODE_564_length_2928_cov_6.657265~~NODE_564_length_2928_cov_6.657265.p1  ORF type:complete len:865 (+),score=251.96 NODE_564_length_2928_cov_6.657265:3-2597(+)